MIVNCDYCQRPSVLVDGVMVYPHRPDLADKQFYYCPPCGAWVGCHGDSDRPLGRLANTELRQAKQDAHAAFDPLWQSGAMKRKAAYAWLAEQLGVERVHIGECDAETCHRVVEICKGEGEEK